VFACSHLETIMSICDHSTIRPVTTDDLAPIARLHEQAFGPGRFARTAYRIREGAPAISPACRVTIVDDRLIAAVGMTEITIGGTAGAYLLGPLVVAPAMSGRGHGRALVRTALGAARDAGSQLVLLVGDLAYYGHAGFAPVEPGRITLPGPVDPARLLAVELVSGAGRLFVGTVRTARV